MVFVLFFVDNVFYRLTDMSEDVVFVLFFMYAVFYRLTDMSEDVVFVHSLDNEDASTDHVSVSVVKIVNYTVSL